MDIPSKTPTISTLQSHKTSLKPQTPITTTFKTISHHPNPTLLKASLKPTTKIFSIDPNNNPAHSVSLNITKLCLKGNLQDALQLWDDILDHENGNIVEEEMCVVLVRLCEARRAVKFGLRVYKVISNLNYLSTKYSRSLGNALVSMLVRFGRLEEAWFVFGKMEERDVFSWNVMIGGYAKNGFLDEALSLYYRMLWVGGIDVRPDIYTFPVVLRACGGIPDVGRGREVHCHVVRLGYESDIDVNNALITMYVKCGDVCRGKRVFDEMVRRDRISWNAMISGYFENLEFLEGMELFLKMKRCGIDSDLMTVTSVISASEFVGDGELGKQIHGFVVKLNFVVDLSVRNSLLEMYCGVGELREAEKLFGRMEAKDVVSWTSMISGYEKNDLPMKSVEAYTQMQLEGVIPDEVTFATVLSACGSLGLLDTGSKIHDFANRTGHIAYPIVRNNLIEMYSKCGCVDKALKVFKQMPEKNVISWTNMISGLRSNDRGFEAFALFMQMKSNPKPNLVTLVAALSACARIGALMCGKEIHAHTLRSGIRFERFLTNALMDMYVRCGRMEFATSLFNTHNDKEVTSWNIILTGYARKGNGLLAIELFERMINASVNPDEVTLVSILCACSKSGMVNEGLDYFNSMEQKYSITPTLKHYACLVDLLGRVGRLKEAHEVIIKMPIEPDAPVWGALLNGCKIHKQVQLGKIAAQAVFDKDSQSAGYYVLLSNLYASSGKWDDVARVRKLMKEKGLSVDPSCSWVEVKGGVHAFLSGDESHPQIKEINGILDGFYERMKLTGSETDTYNFEDVIEASKAEIFCGHSERLAVAFGLINTVPGMPIRVTKNLYMCRSCHNTVKFISKIVRREITVRDTEQFHQFKDGMCSCRDEGYCSKNVELETKEVKTYQKL